MVLNSLLILSNFHSNNWPVTLVKNGVTIFFVAPNEDEQHLSKEDSVIGQDEKPSSSEKRLHKGILESQIYYML